MPKRAILAILGQMGSNGSIGVKWGYLQKRGWASIDPLDPKMPKNPKITKNGTFGQNHPVWAPWDPPGDPKMGQFWTPFWTPYFQGVAS